MRERGIRYLLDTALVMTIAALSISNTVLRHRLDSANDEVIALRHASFRVGDVIPEFMGRDRADHRVRVAATSQRGRVLVIVLPGCGSCERVLNAVSARPSADVTVVSVLPLPVSKATAVRVAPPTSFVAVENVRHSPLAARLRVVPQIIRVSREGAVTEVCKTYEACITHLSDSRSG